MYLKFGIIMDLVMEGEVMLRLTIRVFDIPFLIMSNLYLEDVENYIF